MLDCVSGCTWYLKIVHCGNGYCWCKLHEVGPDEIMFLGDGVAGAGGLMTAEGQVRRDIYGSE